jgi:hypothetical protein
MSNTAAGAARGARVARHHTPEKRALHGKRPGTQTHYRPPQCTIGERTARQLATPSTAAGGGPIWISSHSPSPPAQDGGNVVAGAGRTGGASAGMSDPCEDGRGTGHAPSFRYTMKSSWSLSTCGSTQAKTHCFTRRPWEKGHRGAACLLVCERLGLVEHHVAGFIDEQLDIARGHLGDLVDFRLEIGRGVGRIDPQEGGDHLPSHADIIRRYRFSGRRCQGRHPPLRHVTRRVCSARGRLVQRVEIHGKAALESPVVQLLPPGKIR